MEHEFTSDSLEFYGKVRDAQGISITALTREVVDGLVIYTAVGKKGDRLDSATGAVPIEGLTGVAKADAFKSAETQAKSRLTISLSGIRFKEDFEKDHVATAIVPVALSSLVPTVNGGKAQDEVVQEVVVVQERPTESPTSHGGFFDEPTPIPNVQSAAVLVSPSSTAVSATSIESVPCTTATMTVDPAASTGPPMVYHAFETIPAPPPVSPALPQTATVSTSTETGLPDPTQFRALTGRLAKIVRDVLQKHGIKDANAIILAYVAKTAGTPDLKKVTIAQWEQMLKALEGQTHQAVLKIVKG